MSHHYRDRDDQPEQQPVAYSTLLSNTISSQDKVAVETTTSKSWTSHIKADYFEPTEEEVKYETKNSEHQKHKEDLGGFPNEVNSSQEKQIIEAKESQSLHSTEVSSLLLHDSSKLSQSKESVSNEEDSLLLAETNHDRREISDDEDINDILSSTTASNVSHSLESSIELVEGSLIKDQSIHFVNNNNSSQNEEDSVIVSNVELELERIKAKQEHLQELLQESKISSLLESESQQEEGSNDIQHASEPLQKTEFLEQPATLVDTDNNTGCNFLSALNPLSPKFNFWLTSTAIYSLGTIVILFSTVLYPSTHGK